MSIIGEVQAENIPLIPPPYSTISSRYSDFAQGHTSQVLGKGPVGKRVRNFLAIPKFMLQYQIALLLGSHICFLVLSATPVLVKVGLLVPDSSTFDHS